MGSDMNSMGLKCVDITHHTIEYVNVLFFWSHREHKEPWGWSVPRSHHLICNPPANKQDSPWHPKAAPKAVSRQSSLPENWQQHASSTAALQEGTSELLAWTLASSCCWEQCLKGRPCLQKNMFTASLQHLPITAQEQHIAHSPPAGKPCGNLTRATACG